jgi:hypothetical protein
MFYQLGIAVVSCKAWSTPPMRPPARIDGLMLLHPAQAPKALRHYPRRIMIAIAAQIGNFHRSAGIPAQISSLSRPPPSP